MNNEKILDISWETILKISLAAFVLYVIYLTRNILIWFIFALIISILFNPAINFLHKRKIPRVLAVVLVYIGIFGALSFLIYSTAPFFAHEIRQFVEIFPQYFEKISPPLRGLGLEAFENIDSFIDAFGKALERMAGNIFNALFAIFGGIFSTIFVITLAIFLSLDEKAVVRAFSLLSPKKYEVSVVSIWGRCRKKVSGWFGARILACLFVGLLSYITFLLFNARYPFSLGLLAGVLNFIPIVGPLITGILIFLIVSLNSMGQAVFVLITFTLIQLIENNILTPILTKKFVGLSPALVLISLVIGGKLWGFLGAILAIPLAGILFEFLKEFLQKRKEERAVVL